MLELAALSRPEQCRVSGRLLWQGRLLPFFHGLPLWGLPLPMMAFEAGWYTIGIGEAISWESGRVVAADARDAPKHEEPRVTDLLGWRRGPLR